MAPKQKAKEPPQKRRRRTRSQILADQTIYGDINNLSVAYMHLLGEAADQACMHLAGEEANQQAGPHQHEPKSDRDRLIEDRHPKVQDAHPLWHCRQVF